MESAVQDCFEEVYSRAAQANAGFHKRMSDLVVRFRAARTATDLGLDQARHPLLLRCDWGKLPDYITGPMKTKERARAKYLGWPDGVKQWPPAPLELTDIVRGTVVFDDPFEMVTFVAYLALHFKLVRIANRFEGLQYARDGEETQAVVRFVLCKVLLSEVALPVVAEVQLHFRFLHAAAKEMHNAYEVARAVYPEELLESPPKWQ